MGQADLGVFEADAERVADAIGEVFEAGRVRKNTQAGRFQRD